MLGSALPVLRRTDRDMNSERCDSEQVIAVTGRRGSAELTGGGARPTGECCCEHAGLASVAHEPHKVRLGTERRTE